jgi:hypothetical protein
MAGAAVEQHVAHFLKDENQKTVEAFIEELGRVGRTESVEPS